MENAFPVMDQKVKAFWQRPGGKAGILVAIGAIVVGGYYLAPILTKVVWNLVNFGIALGVAGIVLFLLTNKQLRLGLFYLYESFIRRAIGLIIELDPFVIADNYIMDMVKQRQKLQDESVRVGGQKETISMKIKEKRAEARKEMDRASAAKKNNMGPELGNATRQIARLDEYIKQLVPLEEKLSIIVEYLDKVYKNSAYLIEDAKNELSVKKDLYKSVTAGNRALQSALKIFQGDPEKKMLVEQSMEYIKEDIGKKLAGMKNAISVSSDFMRSIDLDNATFEESGLRMLESYDPDRDFKEIAKTPDAVLVGGREPGKVNTKYYDNLLSSK